MSRERWGWARRRVTVCLSGRSVRSRKFCWTGTRSLSLYGRDPREGQGQRGGTQAPPQTNIGRRDARSRQRGDSLLPGASSHPGPSPSSPFSFWARCRPLRFRGLTTYPSDCPMQPPRPSAIFPGKGPTVLSTSEHCERSPSSTSATPFVRLSLHSINLAPSGTRHLK